MFPDTTVHCFFILKAEKAKSCRPNVREYSQKMLATIMREKAIFTVQCIKYVHKKKFTTSNFIIVLIKY